MHENKIRLLSPAACFHCLTSTKGEMFDADNLMTRIVEINGNNTP